MSFLTSLFKDPLVKLIGLTGLSIDKDPVFKAVGTAPILRCIYHGTIGDRLVSVVLFKDSEPVKRAILVKNPCMSDCISFKTGTVFDAPHIIVVTSRFEFVDYSQLLYFDVLRTLRTSVMVLNFLYSAAELGVSTFDDRCICYVPATDSYHFIGYHVTQLVANALDPGKALNAVVEFTQTHVNESILSLSLPKRGTLPAQYLNMDPLNSPICALIDDINDTVKLQDPEFLKAVYNMLPTLRPTMVARNIAPSLIRAVSKSFDFAARLFPIILACLKVSSSDKSLESELCFIADYVATFVSENLLYNNCQFARAVFLVETSVLKNLPGKALQSLYSVAMLFAPRNITTHPDLPQVVPLALYFLSINTEVFCAHIGSFKSDFLRYSVIQLHVYSMMSESSVSWNIYTSLFRLLTMNPAEKSAEDDPSKETSSHQKGVRGITAANFAEAIKSSFAATIEIGSSLLGYGSNSISPREFWRNQQFLGCITNTLSNGYYDFSICITILQLMVPATVAEAARISFTPEELSKILAALHSGGALGAGVLAPDEDARKAARTLVNTLWDIGTTMYAESKSETKESDSEHRAKLVEGDHSEKLSLCLGESVQPQPSVEKKVVETYPEEHATSEKTGITGLRKVSKVRVQSHMNKNPDVIESQIHPPAHGTWEKAAWAESSDSDQPEPQHRSYMEVGPAADAPASRPSKCDEESRPSQRTTGWMDEESD